MVPARGLTGGRHADAWHGRDLCFSCVGVVGTDMGDAVSVPLTDAAWARWSLGCREQYGLTSTTAAGSVPHPASDTQSHHWDWDPN